MLKIEAFGDSAGYGASDNCAPGNNGLPVCTGYNRRFKQWLQDSRGEEVDLALSALGGYTMTNIYNSMLLRGVANLGSADYITWDGGGNDWRVARQDYKDKICNGTDNQACLRRMVANFKEKSTAAFNLVAAYKKPSATVKVMSYFYPYVREDKSRGIYNVLASYLKQMTDHVQMEATARGYDYTDWVAIFNGSLTNPADPRDYGLTLAGDELHPTQKGHTQIAYDMALKEG